MTDDGDDRLLTARLNEWRPLQADAALLARLHTLPLRAGIPATPVQRLQWAGGMALAASLMLGFFSGTSHVAQSHASANRYLLSMVFGGDPWEVSADEQ